MTCSSPITCPIGWKIFSTRQGFEISRHESVRASGCGRPVGRSRSASVDGRARARLYVAPTDHTIMPMQSIGKTANARMWVYLGDDVIPTTSSTSHLTEAVTDRSIFSRTTARCFADAYGGYNGVVAGNEITRAGCWAHLRRKVIEAEKARRRSRARQLSGSVRCTASKDRLRVYPLSSG